LSENSTYHKGNVREDLLALARQILEQEPVQKITVRGLASKLGMTPRNFYNHFQNLDELLANVAAQEMQKNSVYFAAARNRHRKPLLRLKAGAREFVHMAYKNPELYRMMLGSLYSTLMDYQAFRDAADCEFETTLIEMYGEGVYVPDDQALSRKRCAHGYAYMSLLNGVTRDLIDGLIDLETMEEVDEFVDTTFDSLLRGQAFFDLKDRLS